MWKITGEFFGTGEIEVLDYSCLFETKEEAEKCAQQFCDDEPTMCSWEVTEINV